MDEGYAVERTRDGLSLTREAVEGAVLRFEEGLCAANPHDHTQPRNRQWYLDNVIAPLLEEGKIDDGSRTAHDDRKFRLDAAAFRQGTLTSYLGVTHYQAFRDDLERNAAENARLRTRGLLVHNDPHAYFARCLGVAGLVISSNGAAFLGLREQGDDSALLGCVAGYVTFKDTPGEIDLQADLGRELGEFGLSTKDIERIVLVGLYGHPTRGDLDFTHVVLVNKPDYYFTSGIWQENATEREHGALIRIASLRDAQLLCMTGHLPSLSRQFRLHYSARGALESLTQGELRR